MKKHWKLLTIGLAIATVSVLAVATRTRQPKRQGRSLDSWLQSYTYGSPDQRSEAYEAVRQMAPDSIPYLLSGIRNKHPPWMKFTTAAYRKLVPFKVLRPITSLLPTTYAADQRAANAQLAFYIMGSAGSNAFPELARLATDPGNPEASERAIQTLVSAGPSASAALSQILTNSPAETRLDAIKYIAARHDYGFPGPLLPALRHCLRDTNANTATIALIIITEGKFSQPDETMTVLIDALRQPNPQVRLWALRSIGTFSPVPADATNAVLALTADTNSEVRTEAAALLREISWRSAN
jgi:hypothetical protein